MRRMCFPTLVVAILLGVTVTGCWRGSRPQPVATPETKASVSSTTDSKEPVKIEKDEPVVSFQPVSAEVSQQEKYDTALLDAVNHLAERKYAGALTALEAARAIQDTEQVRREIDKVKAILDQQAAADRTVQDIQTVLNDGKPEEASRLATAALQQYGGTDAAERLTRLKIQADTLLSGQIDDQAGRRKRFRGEGEAALRENNLRAAVIAFDQVLQQGEEADLRKQLDELRARLARYDQNRQRAAELRRDPANLEDAVAALQEASKAWDTLQVRQDIDDCTLALQKRRDRLSVADFEVRGETGIPDAGRSVAEELLPAFKTRFDLVERAQLARVADELKLEADALTDNEEGRREVGKLARLRYLVVGSVSSVGGITVHARLVDVRSGLVVQTGKIAAATPEQLMPLLPELAKVLMMSDEEKMAYEQRLAQQAPPPKPIEVAPVPPPPAANEPPPPPVVVMEQRAPGFGALRPQDFDRLPLPPPQGQAPPPPVIVVDRDELIRQRTFQIALQLGDNHFRRGRYRDAQVQFELALAAAPGHRDVLVRIDRCRPHLPPPVVVLVPPRARPRIAVLDFLTSGNPRVVPPVLGPWTAEHIAPYFCPPYEVVDRAEVYWYMGRLGMTFHDLLVDPSARRWLGRALNVRYFVLGTLRQTASFDVTTHLIDAEYGFQYGTGRIHVHNPYELKLRLGELARLTLMDPRDQVVYLKETDRYQGLLVEAQVHFKKGNFTLAIGVYKQAQQVRPNNVEVLVLLQDSQRRAREAEIEEARRRDWQRQQAIAAEHQRRQWELAREAEAARIRAVQDASANAEAHRRRQEQQRQQAYNQLIVQGQLARKQRNFQLSIQLFESAVALRQDDDGFRELALARAQAEEAGRRRVAEEQAQRETALRIQREQELAQARTQLDEERRKRETREDARRDNQAVRDQAAYTRLLDDAQRYLAKGQYDPAIAALQTARQLRRTEEVERLLNQAMVEQARAGAQKEGEKAKKELERRLAEEKARREQAETEARRNQELYNDALKLAQQAMSQKRYDQAITRYQEARKLFATDVVLTGLRQAEQAQAAEVARADAEKRKKDEDQKRLANFQKLMDEGRTAHQAKQFDRAVRAFQDARKLLPDNVDARVELSKAEQARDAQAAQVRRDKEEKERESTFQTLLDSGRANLKGKQYAAAVVALREALKLKPGDTTALAVLQDAEKAQAAAGAEDARTQAEAKKKAEEYQKRMAEGRLALSSKQYDTAIKAFQAAQKLMPGDQGAATLLREAEKVRQAEADALTANAKKLEEDRKRTEEVSKQLSQGRAALAARNLDTAAKAIAAAARLAPEDAEVKRAQLELQKAQDAARTEAEAMRKRQADYDAQIKTGRAALTAKNYDAAIAAFTEAGRLQPGDRDAGLLLKQAEKARDDARASLDGETKKHAEFNRLVGLAQTASTAKRYDEAVKAYQDALKLMPGDAGATRGLQDAQRAQETARTEADKLKRQADYDSAMKAGRSALAAKKYDDAIKAFADAGKVLPGDRDAALLLKQAEKARDDAKASQDAEARKRVEFDKLVRQAQTASNAKRFDEAIKGYADALKLMPGDAGATRGLQDAQRAQEVARTEADKVKRQAEYQTVMKAGRAALTAGKFDDAIKAFGDAGRLMPGDRDAAMLLKQAEKARDDAKTAQDAEAKRKLDEQKRRTEFNRLMAQGQAAVKAKRYEEAIKAFEDALKQQPGDAGATQALTGARQALEASKKPAPPDGKAEYAKQMQLAANHEKQKNWDEASKAYREALRLMPGDAKASAALKSAEFESHMAQGDQFLKAKKFKEAVRAFEDALKLFPNNAEAKKNLSKAKAGKP